MISKGPARTFTREAVEAWLVRLTESDWEIHISKQILHKGRTFYRDGVLSSVDVQESQIVVTQKINRIETYSVIEWSAQKPQIRTSSQDEEIGIALGTAGLYEIEELVAEVHEEDPLLETLSFSEIETKTAELENLPGSGCSQVENPDKEKAIPALILIEISLKHGLSLTPFWLIAKDHRIKAYGKDKESGKSNTDRPTLMRFVAETGKQGFRFEKNKGSFRMNDWKKIATFADELLPIWETSFNLEYDGDARLLKHGQRKLTWEIEARSRNNDEMSLREKFRLGSHHLSREHSKRISKTRNGSTFLPGHGLVKLEQEQLEDFDWWQRNRGDSTRANWPRYMLFSLFARKYLNARPDGKLSEWQESIFKKAKNLNTQKFAFLRPYQREGVSHLNALHKMGCHGLLADEMGLGKTVQALALIANEKGKSLCDIVICPASVVPVWVRETNERFPKIRARVLNKENFFNQNDECCLWVASYTQLRRHRHLLDDTKFRYAILDEAQLIKNPQAKVTQACLSINAQKRLALSGTPIENSALDLWTIFRFLMPGLLGGRKEMENELTSDSEGTIQLIRKQITPFILRRIKSEVATELPPKIENELVCTLNDDQRREYRKISEGAISSHSNNLREALREAPTHVFSLLTRLRQTCCDLALLPWNEGLSSSGSKSEILIEKLSDLATTGCKIIVFSQFTSFLKILKNEISKKINDLKILELTGSTKNRTLPVQEFETYNGPAVILASLKAAGLGVTLKSADYVFLMDPWWNPAIEEQAIDRAHRLGRTKPTFIYRLVTKGTVEERVRNLQHSKKETFQKIIGEIDRPIGLAEHFSTLNELISLTDN